MISRGFGLGYETTGFEEAGPDGLQRIAAFVFWRGGGIDPRERSGGVTVGVAPPFVGSSPGRRVTLPFRYLALAILFPFAWVADRVLDYREGRRFRNHKFVPMSAAVQEARQWARYQAGTLQINARKFTVPESSTLILFVEDDPSQDDDLAISTHLIPTEAHVSGAGAPDGVHIHFMRGPARMLLAIQGDPVCQEFIRRVRQ